MLPSCAYSLSSCYIVQVDDVLPGVLINLVVAPTNTIDCNRVMAPSIVSGVHAIIICKRIQAHIYVIGVERSFWYSRSCGFVLLPLTKLQANLYYGAQTVCKL